MVLSSLCPLCIPLLHKSLIPLFFILTSLYPYLSLSVLSSICPYFFPLFILTSSRPFLLFLSPLISLFHSFVSVHLPNWHSVSLAMYLFLRLSICPFFPAPHLVYFHWKLDAVYFLFILSIWMWTEIQTNQHSLTFPLTIPWKLLLKVTFNHPSQVATFPQ